MRFNLGTEGTGKMIDIINMIISIIGAIACVVMCGCIIAMCFKLAWIVFFYKDGEK